jgi:hypothetical protein
MPILLSSHVWGVVGTDKEKPQAAATTWGREPEESALLKEVSKMSLLSAQMQIKASCGNQDLI